MLQWLKEIFRGPTHEELLISLSAFEALTGRTFFQSKSCPFSKYVRENGVLSRQFSETRHDN
jgi:hypothetical protein